MVLTDITAAISLPTAAAMRQMHFREDSHLSSCCVLTTYVVSTHDASSCVHLLCYLLNPNANSIVLFSLIGFQCAHEGQRRRSFAELLLFICQQEQLLNQPINIPQHGYVVLTLLVLLILDHIPVPVLTASLLFSRLTAHRSGQGRKTVYHTACWPTGFEMSDLQVLLSNCFPQDLLRSRPKVIQL